MEFVEDGMHHVEGVLLPLVKSKINEEVGSQRVATVKSFDPVIVSIYRYSFIDFSTGFKSPPCDSNFNIVMLVYV